ncbi:hypothetical protein C8J57DRAFT_1437497 [Mycena rebaudengoi]|nr:hypothetical protein C8J57DRAFT_1437497 [Mycena rebaudengoi]
MYALYVRTLRALCNRHPHLCHNFSNSIFPAVTFNCGPRSVAYDHRDHLNKAGGWCAVTSAGRFNHKKGGHMYFKQIKTVVEFPSGSTLLIPSGAMDHGNTPIADDEERYSITQYAAGGLFRWAAYSFQSGASLMSQPGGQEEKARIDGQPGERWSEVLDLFSKVDELEADFKAVFG